MQSLRPLRQQDRRQMPPLRRIHETKNIGWVGAVGLLLLVVVFAAIVISNRESSIGTPPKITADCTLQAGRKEFLQKKVEEGYWMQIERPEALFRVKVMPKFIDNTTLEEKKRLISTVSAYDFCLGGDGVLTVVDAMTGNELGHFNEYGLHWEQ